MTPSDTLAPPPSSTSTAVGDTAALRRLLRFGGWTLLDALTAMYLEQAPVKIAALRAALADGDVAGVELAAHSFKSSSAQLGAPRLQALCQDAERRARAGTLDGIAPWVEAMEGELAEYATWLATARQTLEHP